MTNKKTGATSNHATNPRKNRANNAILKTQQAFKTLKNVRQKSSGFTLIELIVVIVILGVLAATAMPKFMNMRRDARIASINGMVGALRSTLGNFDAFSRLESAKDAQISVPNTAAWGDNYFVSYLDLPTGERVFLSNRDNSRAFPIVSIDGVGAIMGCKPSNRSAGRRIGYYCHGFETFFDPLELVVGGSVPMDKVYILGSSYLRFYPPNYLPSGNLTEEEAEAHFAVYQCFASYGSLVGGGTGVFDRDC